MDKLDKHQIGFIGGGQMALAIGKGFLAAGLIKPNQVLTSAPSDNNLKTWRKHGVLTTHNNAEVVVACDIIFLAVKPNMFQKVVDEMENEKKHGILKENTCSSGSKLFVSVMAGITLETMQKSLEKIVTAPRVIRTLPNTPSMVGCGCAVFSSGPGVTESDAAIIKQLFSSVGMIEYVPEYQQDAFAGMAGSGPAYMYTIIEAFSDGGVRMGLPRALATKFAAQMVMGSAKMVLETGKHTGRLKEEVTSPGGTTIRGIQVLEKNGVRGIIMEAVQASAEAAMELGKKK